MITNEVKQLLHSHGLYSGVAVRISVPGGSELARKTFNPKLGIIGGISIIGTSGIVRPFSSEAFVNSIRKEIQVARALGCTDIVINSGAKSENYLRTRFPDLPPQAFIHYGNYIGETLRLAEEEGITRVTMGIMIGKAVKLAEGHLDTHSRNVVMNRDFITALATESHCPPENIAKVAGAGTLVPITGFANSVAACALEFKAEGEVFGVGCKIFTIAGPVILYGIVTSWVLGAIYWVVRMFA